MNGKTRVSSFSSGRNWFNKYIKLLNIQRKFFYAYSRSEQVGHIPVSLIIQLDKNLT